MDDEPLLESPVDDDPEEDEELELVEPLEPVSFDPPVDEPVVLDDEQALLHRHKLEFALQKDRDAALQAERDADVAAAAQQAPVQLVQQLAAALQQSLVAAGAAAAVTDPA